MLAEASTGTGSLHLRFLIFPAHQLPLADNWQAYADPGPSYKKWHQIPFDPQLPLTWNPATLFAVILVMTGFSVTTMEDCNSEF